MQVNPTIESKMNEAEAYRSMKLFSDSLQIYEGILTTVPQQDTDTHAKVQNRIRLIKQEIYDYENREA